tara:strand:+ start:2780 stop:3727 length:948 start_codon:yes stop_codon:yes gene_type:complete
MIFEISIIALLIALIILLVLILQQYKKSNDSPIKKDLEIDINILKETIDGLRNSQQLTTNELSKSVSELYTLMTKGRSGHQGQLGETSLRMILEYAGLKSGVNFDEQKMIGSEKPDVVVHLPDNRKVVIDSKVSLADYSSFINSDNKEQSEIAKKNHINSVKKHIKTLSSTEYRSLYGNDSLDLVIMFMNIEGAYILACEDDIIGDALRNKIAIVGPTTLIAILQIISRVWSNKRQSEDTYKIINQATSIYEAAVLLTECFNDFNDLYNKSNEKIIIGLRRSQILVNKVEKMRKIGGLEPKRLTPENLRKINDNE